MFPSSAPLNTAGWCHLAYFGVLLPILVACFRKKVVSPTGPLPDRLRHFQRTVLELGLFLAASLMVARVQRINLFPPPSLNGGAVVAGLAAYALAVVYMRPRWRRAVELRARVVHLFMPSNATERAWWIAVSLLAGFGEEVTWRGVQVALVGALTGGYWVAALLCSVSFGLAHLVQGWASAAVIDVFALGFHLLVWLDGSLYVAIAVHVAYDLTAGISYGRLGQELGYGSDSGGK